MTKEELRLQLARCGLARSEQVYQAGDIAEQAMAGKFRRSGDPAVSHAYAVAGYMLGIGGSWVEVSAALLHDLDEDTEIGIAKIRDWFGPEVTFLVEAVTCDKEFNPLNWEEQARLYYAKVYRCAQQDPRVLVLKLADRLHYFRTCGVMPPISRERKAHETVDILLPMTAMLQRELAGYYRRVQPWVAELNEESQLYLGRQDPFVGFFSSPQVRPVNVKPALAS